MAQIIGAFPDNGLGVLDPAGPIVLQDSTGIEAASGWTSGAANVFPVPVSPTVARPWTVSSWGIVMQGLLSCNGQSFGTLGKIYASLLTGAVAFAPQVGNFTGIPSSAVPNLTEIWDGGNDAPFPQSRISGVAFPYGGLLTAYQQLPQPLTVNAGDQIALGLWLTPSELAGTVDIAVLSANYVINFDS